VQALLTGGAAGASPRSVERAAARASRGRLGRGWLVVVPMVFSMALTVAIIFRPWRAWQKRPAPTPAPTAVEPAKPLSEARQLMAKAQALYEPWDGATREDFALAEQLLKRAVELDPSDGEVWATYGILACVQVMVGHDRSPARVDLARATTERAMKLAPDSKLARFAQAFSFRFNESTRDDAEKIMRELIAQDPGNRMVLRTLAALLRTRGRHDEALVFLDRAIALPGGDPVAVYNKFLSLWSAGRFTEAEAAIDTAFPQPSAPYLYRAKAMCLMTLHGDLDRAAETMAKSPARYLLEEKGAYWASLIALWRRDVGTCLAVWHKVPRDLIETSEFRGPKAFIVGQAQHLAGRQAAAQAEWSAALRIVEQQLAAQPNAVHWIYWKARLLASLQRTTEAEEILRTFEQLIGAKGLTNDTIPIYLLLGHRAEVLQALEKAHAHVVALNNPGSLASWLNNLRFNPEWDLIREEPRFIAIVNHGKKPDGGEAK
jgi:tetratricopeptide (TPR) repeat protein